MEPSEGRFEQGRFSSAERLRQSAPEFHFTNVPAELRERLIEELKARSEFTKVYDAAVHGAGVTLSLTMPDPVEFTYGGHHFTAFAWMGQIHVFGKGGQGL